MELDQEPVITQLEAQSIAFDEYGEPDSANAIKEDNTTEGSECKDEEGKGEELPVEALPEEPVVPEAPAEDPAGLEDQSVDTDHKKQNSTDTEIQQKIRD